MTVQIYSWGLVAMSVCTDEDDQAAIEREANAQHPTGIDSRWHISDEPFHGGEPNPSPCADRPDTHKHYLLTC